MIRVFTEQPFILFFVSELEDMRQNDRHNIQASLWMSLESQRLVLSTAVARLIYTLEDPSMGFAVWDRRRRRLRNAVRRPHHAQRPVLGHIYCFRQCKIMGFQILLYGAQPCDAGASSLSPPVLWRESCQLTGSSWHMRYRQYAQWTQKGSGDVIGLLQ